MHEFSPLSYASTTQDKAELNLLLVHGKGTHAEGVTLVERGAPLVEESLYVGPF
jgi:hypothetical protein